MISRSQAQAMAMLPVAMRWWREVVSARTINTLKRRRLVEVALTGDVVLNQAGREALADYRSANPGAVLERPTGI